jgi:hypothetical protein
MVHASNVAPLASDVITAVADYFNHHHDKLLCTANAAGEPSIALMGTPRVTLEGRVDFEISDPVSTTLDNIRENKAVAFMVFVPGPRARDFRGVRIHAQVEEVQDSGTKFDAIRQGILERHGPEKAAELEATVSCRILKIRPIVDRNQPWDAPPFPD